MQNHGIRFVSTVMVSLLILGGCQSDITLSRAVRKGDTIVVSLGDANPNGEYSNVKSTLLREADISANVLDSGWVLSPVKVRHVFRVYGDPTAVNSKARGQAQWMAVIDLVNPVNNTKPNLTIGQAALVLESTKFNERQIVKTEILAGSGTPHPFISQNEPVEFGIDKMTLVKPAKQALVRVSGTLPQGVKLAGAEYQFDIPAVHTLNMLSERMEAVAPAKLPASQQVYFEFKRTERQAPVGTDVLVALTSTEGVDQASLSAFDFVMTSDQEAIANNPNYWQNKLIGATFYSTDGQEIAGLTGSVGTSE
ncbi:MAG: hypothetical protein IPG64_12480 [Haliea sp.]|nr:hypothetical protein [Haliea sp.]MBK6738658.1 hypothetical protein [Haliea sp.]